MDENLWSEPKEFNPERFLNNEPRVTLNHPNLIMFGAGKRSCPGEQLANQELFLICANLLQRFRFSLPEGKGWICETPRNVPMRAPEPFDLAFEMR